MNDVHLVIGSGPVGTQTALLLSSLGHEVVLGSRSGQGPALHGVRRVAVDAADVDSLTALSTRAAVLYNCVNPPSYDVWTSWWPPVARAFLATAERTGAVLATASCLYAYGEVDGPMVEGMADGSEGVKGRIRAGMWAEVQAAHESGRIRGVEVRGSDYLGPGVSNAHIPVVAAKALVGKSVRVFGSAEQPHTWTDVRDMARALVATATTPTAHGRVWHAPSNAPRTQTQAVADICRAADRDEVRVRAWPGAMTSAGGLLVPFLREMRETLHQFERPFVMDSSDIEQELGLIPTAWEDVCRATAVQAGVRESTLTGPR